MCVFCLECFKLPCVSQLWRQAFREVVRENLSHWKIYSNKLLSCFEGEKGPLDLGLNYRISNHTLKSLTNLTELDLQLNSRISHRSIKKLTNMKKLNLRKNKKILDNSLNYLRNIEDLDLDRNIRITNLPVLTNLTKLQLNRYSLESI
jgi:hypothetical protein